MKAVAASSLDLGSLLRGDPTVLSGWVERWSLRHLGLNLATIIIGTAAYGAAVGIWRDEWQALYTAIKFPLLIMLTTFGNALLNGMLAPLMGARLRMRESLLAVLMSFATASAILGAFSPILFFLVWNSPPVVDRGVASAAHSVILLVHVLVVGFAGVVGNLKLLRYLTNSVGSRGAASKLLLSWLAANLFFGAQLSWILRPFVGAPDLPIEFLRPNALEGNFYENVLYHLRSLL